MTKTFPPNGSSRLSSAPHLLRWDPADTGTASALYEVNRAAELADEPVTPPESAGPFQTKLSGPWEGAPGEVWFAPGAEDGSAVGYYRLGLPDLENLDRAELTLVVHPAARRRGADRELLRHAARRAAAHGREFIDSEVLTGSAGDAFARRVGATFALEEVRRVQDLRAIRPGTVAALRAEAARHGPATRWSAGATRCRRSTWRWWRRRTTRSVTRRAARAWRPPCGTPTGCGSAPAA